MFPLAFHVSIFRGNTLATTDGELQGNWTIWTFESLTLVSVDLAQAVSAWPLID